MLRLGELGWRLLGLSWGRLRYAACTSNIGIVTLRYALTDRDHHVRSPPPDTYPLPHGAHPELPPKPP